MIVEETLEGLCKPLTSTRWYEPSCFHHSVCKALRLRLVIQRDALPRAASYDFEGLPQVEPRISSRTTPRYEAIRQHHRANHLQSHHSNA